MAFSDELLSNVADDASQLVSSIATLKSRLADFIEPDYGLLDQLLSVSVLTRRQYDDVRCERRAAYRRTEVVLELLTTEDRCRKFLRALERTGQQHVAIFIKQNGGEKKINNDKLLAMRREPMLCMLAIFSVSRS